MHFTDEQIARANTIQKFMEYTRNKTPKPHLTLVKTPKCPPNPAPTHEPSAETLEEFYALQPQAA